MNDVFISYAHIDDQPMMEGQRGWISQFHRSLEVRMAQLLGQELKIWRDPKLQGSDLFDEALVQQFSDSKVLVSVLTPRYVRSEWCRRELEEFVRVAAAHGGITAENKSRIFKVVKTPVAAQEIPPPLDELFSRLLGFEFYEVDPETGRLREYDETFGVVARQRFFERIYDLAHEICTVLKIYQPATEPAAGRASGKTVYLATTTLELQPERDKIRRELLERGHRVLPEAPLPFLTREIETTVKACLEQSAVAVHLLGRHYGATPEDAAESVPALQLRWSAEQARQQTLPRLIWLPGEGETTDERQRAFLGEIQDQPKWHFSADLFEGNLTLLKKDLIQKLSPAEKKPASSAAVLAPVSSPARVYVICEPADEPAVEPLEDFLFEQGLEVCLPAADAGSADASTLHRDNLLNCDGVLVFYGSAPRAWVDIKLRDILKAVGYGRAGPVAVQGVYLAPPLDHRKERFRSHNAQVISAQADFSTNTELLAFVRALKEARV
ncbi:MAG: TIR domain-containing protein [Opitutaceae bacterium]|nr:TIR domain-containing protein [Opitutaceae bacterium]